MTGAISRFRRTVEQGWSAEMRQVLGRVWWRLRWHVGNAPVTLVVVGLPPRILGWRWMRRETPMQRCARRGDDTLVIVERASVGCNPLPANFAARVHLSNERGWFGYAMSDVPSRISGQTALAHLSDVRIAAYRDGPRRNFTVGMIGADERAIDAPQIVFRPRHGQILDGSAPRVRLERATWILERAYDNHSHWLTAHLPKILLLQRLGKLDGLILPKERTATIDESLGMIGIDPGRFTEFDAGTVLEVKEMTLVCSDRFSPFMLRPMRDALVPASPRPTRRLFISRSRARGRRLLNEDVVWRDMEARGFERVFMEDIGFADQVRLMSQTAILVAPHGAGLTNMIFCPEGTDVVEIADLTYPNPNFYAIASALGHRFWLVGASTTGAGHALERDLQVDSAELGTILSRIETERSSDGTAF